MLSHSVPSPRKASLTTVQVSARPPNRSPTAAYVEGTSGDDTALVLTPATWRTVDYAKL